MTDLSSDIATNAGGPKKGRDDAGSFEQHELTEQIEADKYLSKKAAASASALPFRVAKLRPPGAV